MTISIKVKVILIIFTVIINLNTIVFGTSEIISSQLESLDLSDLKSMSEQYTKDTFPDIDIESLINSLISGNINHTTIQKNILTIFGEEFYGAVGLIGNILIIIVLHSILRNIAEGLENDSLIKVVAFAQYILIVTLIVSNFSYIIKDVEKSLSNLTTFLYTLIPILIALIAATGSGISANLVQTILLFATSLIGNIIKTVIVPIILGSTILSILSNLSERVRIDKISKFLKSSALWIFGIITTVFMSALSLEGNLASNIDGVAIKGVKAATSGLIPVVGKTLSDSISIVLGCTSIIKNAIGIIGIIVVIGICAVPIIKLTVLTILYSFTAAICEPIAEKNIVNIIEQMAGTFKILLGIMFFIATLFIIGIAITLKISNASLMMRIGED